MLSVNDYWNFPGIRDPDITNTNNIESFADKLTRSEWLIPPSRNEQVLEINNDVSETESLNLQFIESFLQHLSTELRDLWTKMPRNIIDQIKLVSKVIMVEAINSVISTKYGNETKTVEYVMGRKVLQ